MSGQAYVVDLEAALKRDPSPTLTEDELAQRIADDADPYRYYAPKDVATSRGRELGRRGAANGVHRYAVALLDMRRELKAERKCECDLFSSLDCRRCVLLSRVDELVRRAR